MRFNSRLIPALVSACGLTACASEGKPAAPALATQAAQMQVVGVSKLTGDQIVALQRQGYKLVTANGTTLYCRADPKTGTRLQHENICMTEQEIISLREETQRGLQNITTQVPPPQGK